jgi:hypothetical protein
VRRVACIRDMRNLYTMSVARMKNRNQLEDLCVDGRTILKSILNK